MVQRRRHHISQLSLRIEGLRANVLQFKQDEFQIQQALCGASATAKVRDLEDAFDEIRESINHTEALLEALVQVAGGAGEEGAGASQAAGR
ncbi:hypothetical protein [Pseudomonas chlororaphis]|uniref:hypothetical protein n=1 Tax=Pseudomonas chlororaphis TaxID=587753 RepID=UPI0006A57E43|nr:hypothetical protein [Pseudomonas chlororaphis]AZD03176.1 hypothetical protein C4K27_3986 [Pseudomonas chlororaphis subsp. chlororaphis]MBM0282689.1 hypothetical protein [Pseudomonas chlororaphis]MDO1506677.1 hypothetical protein [Pseudomonas chlororaphis]ORM45791.1 hypothetical protein B6D51_23415 [Pseudomonas chlororaphis subsp. chlororaphis]TWR91679.1 hypothetical protein FJD36_23725 [Pseudomonas chlororaphis subsp. chlororaphis]